MGQRDQRLPADLARAHTELVGRLVDPAARIARLLAASQPGATRLIAVLGDNSRLQAAASAYTARSEELYSRLGAATLRKMAGEGSAEVVAGPGVQQEVA